MASKTSALDTPVPLLGRSDRIDRRRDVKWQQWPEMRGQHHGLDDESLRCRHPDLEDGSLVAWGLQQSQNATGEGIEIDVLYGDGVDLSRNDKRHIAIL